MKTLYDHLQESLLDSDTQITKNLEVNILVQLLLSGKAKKKDLDSLKNEVAVWKPKDKDELKKMVDSCTEIDPKCSLNWIDVSEIETMYYMFYSSKFNGDISKWDVSKVENMGCMFCDSDFNRDISKWDVSKVENMYSMFYNSRFNRDISKWDVSKVENMGCMFSYSKFNRDISKWRINKDCFTHNIFKNCPIKEEYKPKLNN